MIQRVNNISKILFEIQKNLTKRKHKNWINNSISVLLEEIVCSMQIFSEDNFGFVINYKCKGDPIIAHFPSDNVHMKHCLWEIFCYLELYEFRGGLLPVRRELQELKLELKNLLQSCFPVMGSCSIMQL